MSHITNRSIDRELNKEGTGGLRRAVCTMSSNGVRAFTRKTGLVRQMEIIKVLMILLNIYVDKPGLGQ